MSSVEQQVLKLILEYEKLTKQKNSNIAKIIQKEFKIYHNVKYHIVNNIFKQLTEHSEEQTNKDIIKFLQNLCKEVDNVQQANEDGLDNYQKLLYNIKQYLDNIKNKEPEVQLQQLHQDQIITEITLTTEHIQQSLSANQTTIKIEHDDSFRDTEEIQYENVDVGSVTN